MQKSPKLSIVILNYNTKKLLGDCLTELKKVEGEVSFETVVVDNGSSDGSASFVKEKFLWVKLIESSKNLGFAKGNNLAKSVCRGEFVLFLNSDSLIKGGVLKNTLQYLDDNPDVGALTCKLVLPSGELDKDARRSFPTPWVSFTHLVLPVDRLFPTSRFFARYWYGYISEKEIHEVDVIQGAFFLTRRSILDKVCWFDEDYFLDGEDIDLCWKIKKLGYKILYYPKVSLIHIKGASKGKKKSFGTVTKEERLNFINAGVNSMETFYRKRLWGNYPLILNYGIIFMIKFLKGIRYLRALLS